MTKREEYRKAKAARVEAEKWQAMPEKPGRNGDSFKMSAAHGNLKLVRCGQYTTGGQNYWDLPERLSKAILRVIENDPAVILAGIELLKQAEKAALLECEEEAKAMLAMIEEAKTEAE